MPEPQTYIFAGGGTGGHLFPGIAVAMELARRESGSRLLFVGSERELERAVLSRHGFEHRTLPVESLRELTRCPWRFVARNWAAWKSARRLLKIESPAAVIGLGGYASAPVVWAASRVGCPVVLLEQNVIPGRTTRWLSRRATLVCSSFDEAIAHLPHGIAVEVTGNPVREEIAHFAERPADSTQRTPELLILGGSQGADSLNEAVLLAMSRLRDDLSGWRVVHQAGPRQVELLRREYAALLIEAIVEPFFDDMLARYSAATLVVSRAGATTLAELACCGLPMILLPFKHSADDHQRANALAYQNRGAALCIEHRDTAEQTASELIAPLCRLLRDERQREAMGSAARSASRPDATQRVAEQILKIVRR